MSSGADQYSILYKSNQQKVQQKAPARYWKGKAPQWMKISQQSDSDDDKDKDQENYQKRYNIQHLDKEIKFQGDGTNKVPDQQNKRLSRLAQRKSQRQIKRTVVVQQQESDQKYIKQEKKQEKGLTIQEKRNILKQKALQKRRKQLVENQQKKKQEAVKAQGHSQQQSSCQSDEDQQQQEKSQQDLHYKPVFVPKSQRATIKEKEKLEQQQESRKLAEINRQKQKQEETQIMVQSALERESKLQKEVGYDSQGQLPSDEIPTSEKQIELQKWRLRQLGRIKRDHQQKLQRQIEKKEMERRHNLTQAERYQEDLKLGTDDTEKVEKQKYSYMQKYYKNGGYFQFKANQKDDHIYKRDYNAPTAMDKVDRSTLPQILQKRRGQFGAKGQTKWTHLSNQDTTQFQKQYVIPSTLHQKHKMKMAGYKSSHQIQRPSRKK